MFFRSVFMLLLLDGILFMAALRLRFRASWINVPLIALNILLLALFAVLAPICHYYKGDWPMNIGGKPVTARFQDMLLTSPLVLMELDHWMIVCVTASALLVIGLLYIRKGIRAARTY